MKKFLKKILLFLTLPLVLIGSLLLLYITKDPFKVVQEYDHYESNDGIALNRDYVSTENFLNKFKKNNYNSFIFGSSRTIAYDPLYWKKKLLNCINPFMFDASGENIFGINTKIKFLDSLDVKIDNVIIIICTDYTFPSNSNLASHGLIKHPAVTHESELDFQYSFASAFFKFDFLTSYIPYTLIGEFKPYMTGVISPLRHMNHVDTLTNRVTKVLDETNIKKDSVAFYLKYEHRFYRQRDKNNRLLHEVIFPEEAIVKSKKMIGDTEQKMLREILSILKKHNTKFKVILHPLLSKEKFNPKDMKFLKALFGDNLYDFTGLNKFTKNYRDCYDWSHLRPFRGYEIIDLIYNDTIVRP